VVTFHNRLAAADDVQLERRYANDERAQRRTVSMARQPDKEIYAKIALRELAKELRALAERSEPARVVNQN
jgi:hypothetical protein